MAASRIMPHPAASQAAGTVSQTSAASGGFQRIIGSVAMQRKQVDATAEVETMWMNNEPLTSV